MLRFHGKGVDPGRGEELGHQMYFPLYLRLSVIAVPVAGASGC